MIIGAIALPILIFLIKYGWPMIKDYFNKGHERPPIGRRRGQELDSRSPHAIMLATILLLGLVLIATGTDLARHQIYNWTTYCGIVGGLGPERSRVALVGRRLRGGIAASGHGLDFPSGKPPRGLGLRPGDAASVSPCSRSAAETSN